MKRRLCYAWGSAPIAEAPAALTEAAGTVPDGTRYVRATTMLDTVGQHTVHILYVGKTALVTWTGRGVRVGAVVSATGGIEAVKRKIETGAVSLVPKHSPLRAPGVRAPRRKRTPDEKVGFDLSRQVPIGTPYPNLPI